MEWKGSRHGMRPGGVSGGSAVCMRPRVAVSTVALQVAVQAGPSDAKDLRSAEAVSIAHLQYLLAMHFAALVQSERLPVFVAGQPRRAVLQMLGHVAQVDEVSCRRDARRRDDILQFPHIPRPGVLQQHSLCPSR